MLQGDWRQVQPPDGGGAGGASEAPFLLGHPDLSPLLKTPGPGTSPCAYFQLPSQRRWAVVQSRWWGCVKCDRYVQAGHTRITGDHTARFQLEEWDLAPTGCVNPAKPQCMGVLNRCSVNTAAHPTIQTEAGQEVKPGLSTLAMR